jgi:hypothetical protein
MRELSTGVDSPVFHAKLSPTIDLCLPKTPSELKTQEVPSIHEILVRSR